MQIPMQITIRDMDYSEALEAHIYIREKVKKLEEFSNDMTTCLVVVEVPHKHQHDGKQFNVCIDIAMHDNRIIVSRSHAEDVYIALRDAFSAVKHQLEDYARKFSVTSRLANHSAQTKEIIYLRSD